MEAAKESTLFDRYVRDVVGASIITDAAMSKYYTQHQDQFGIPAQWKVRHIVITANPNGPQARSKEQALERIKLVATELHSDLAAVNAAGPAVATQARLNRFAALARQYSEDSAAASGGDLGWVSRGQLDPDFEAAMLALKPGGMSGIVTTKFGYHIILLEDQRPASTMSFESAKPAIREALLIEHGLEIIEAVSKLTNELRANSKISLYPENIK
jgi:parvulin-like peptidyl-prolyl isomerase